MYQDYGIPSISIYNKQSYIIDKNYGKNYNIILNPFPHFYGETILFHDNQAKFNDEDDDFFEIPDYGRLPSLRHIQHHMDIIQVLSNENVKLNCEFIAENHSHLYGNLYDMNSIPFSDNDLTYLIKGISGIDGLGMIKILPYGFYDYKTFSSNNMKLIKLPLKDIDYEDLPITLKINQKIKSLKRQRIKDLYNNASNKEDRPIETTEVEQLLNHDDFNIYFDHIEEFSIETYHFPHLIKYYNVFTFKLENIKKDLRQIMNKLDITNENRKGMIVLIHTNYLFVAPLIKPYMHHNEVPMFAEPHFFAGIYTLPLIEAEWPNTTNSKYINYDFEEILRISTTE
jgi:hypothetical protein